MDYNNRNIILKKLRINPIEALKSMDSTWLEDEIIFYEITTNPSIHSAIYSLGLMDRWKDDSWIIWVIKISGIKRVRDFISRSGVLDEKVLDEKELLLRDLNTNNNFNFKNVNEKLSSENNSSKSNTTKIEIAKDTSDMTIEELKKLELQADADIEKTNEEIEKLIILDRVKAKVERFKVLNRINIKLEMKRQKKLKLDKLIAKTE